MLPNAFDTAVIILAAGEGKRMKSNMPKVMHTLSGAPLIEHAVRAVEASGVCQKPVVVISRKHTAVSDYLGDRAAYAVQEEQLGTGHAVASAEHLLIGTAEHVAVVYGDMPFLSPRSLRKLVERHRERKNTLTLMTVTVPNFSGEFAPFDSFGRIVRGANGHVRNIVEKNDCTPAEAAIPELNPAYYCFASAWLWAHVKQLENKNAQREYYLTDLVRMAIDEGARVSSISIDPSEAMGVNTLEDLRNAERRM